LKASVVETVEASINQYDPRPNRGLRDLLTLLAGGLV